VEVEKFMAEDDVVVREQKHHDKWASETLIDDVPVEETFSASTSPEPQWLVEQMGDLRGKRVLDIGCGAGEAATYFGMLGAKVSAIDISPRMCELARRVAAQRGVHIETLVCSAEDLSAFKEESFDIVYGANILHHVDIEECLN